MDCSPPSTPSHFLTGKPVGFQPQLGLNNDDLTDLNISSKDLAGRHTILEDRLDQSWTRWSQDYLRNLPPTANKFQKRGDLQIGSVVLIKEDNIPRLKWPVGIINELFHGKDGLIRSVNLKTSKGMLVRPIQRLYDLEVNHQFKHDAATPEVPSTSDIAPVPQATNAASECHIENIKDSAQPFKTSRSGRIIKPRERLDL